MLSNDLLRILESDAFIDYTYQIYNNVLGSPVSKNVFKSRVLPMLFVTIIEYLSSINSDGDEVISTQEVNRALQKKNNTLIKTATTKLPIGTEKFVTLIDRDGDGNVTTQEVARYARNKTFEQIKGDMEWSQFANGSWDPIKMLKLMKYRLNMKVDSQQQSIQVNNVLLKAPVSTSVIDYCKTSSKCGVIPRSFMPQFDKEGSLEKYIEQLKKIDITVAYYKKDVDITRIQPLQSNANKKKVEKLARIFRSKGWNEKLHQKDPFTLFYKNGSYFLLNGHHRFFAVLEYNKEAEQPINSFNDANVIDIGNLSLSDALEETFKVNLITQKNLGGEKMDFRKRGIRRTALKLKF